MNQVRTLLFGFVGLLAVSCVSTRDPSIGSRPPGSKSDLVAGERAEIVDLAVSLVGTRYRYGGITPKSGFDCSGFTLYVTGQHGYALPRTSGDQALRGKVVDIKNTKPGDLVFFGRGKKVGHVALIVRRTGKSLEIVHSSSSKGVIREDIYKSDYWKSRLLFAADLESY